MKVKGNAFKYGDNVDTDVIIPARYLNSSKAEELAAHCMEDIDKNFVKEVKREIFLRQIKTLAAVLQENMRLWQLRPQVSAA